MPRQNICCFIDTDWSCCNAPARWMIRYSGHFEDYTHACSRHVMELGDPTEHCILPIELNDGSLDLLSVRLPKEGDR
jgi:hypothetical protein